MDTGFLPLIRRWWWVLALGALGAGLIASVIASRVAPTYESQVRLLVGPVNTDFSTLRAAGELGRTYADLATSRPVAEAAIRETGAAVSPDELQRSMAATSNGVTRVVTIRVRNGEPRTAARLANALAARLEQLSRRAPAEETDAIRDFLGQDEVESLTPGDRAKVHTAVTRVLGQSLAGRLQVVDPARASSDPVAPRTKLIALLAALAGLLGTGVLIVVKEATDRGIEDEQSLGTLEKIPYLGAIATPSPNGSGSLVVNAAPRSAAAESYRVLAAKIASLDGGRPMRSLLVLGSDDGGWSGLVAANLAAALAEAETRVLLVDADTARGEVTKLLGLRDRKGYTDVFANGDDAAALQVRQTDDLAVLPRGSTGVPSLLDAERAQSLLKRLHGDADVVVVSAPPVDRSPSALIWARAADGTVLVVDAGRTSRDRVAGAVTNLSLVGGKLVGTVLSRKKRFRLGFREREGKK